MSNLIALRKGCQSPNLQALTSYSGPLIEDRRAKLHASGRANASLFDIVEPLSDFLLTIEIFQIRFKSFCLLPLIMVNIQDLPPELLTRIIFFIAPLRGPLPPGFLEKLSSKKPNNDADSSAVANPNEDDVSRVNTDQTLDDEDAWEDEIKGQEKDEKETLGPVYSRPHRDLRNLCLVSRLFRDLAQPYLFYNFEDMGLSGYLTQTVSFAQALYLRPQLGEHVRELDIMPPADDERPKPLSAADSALLKAAIKDLQLGAQEKAWISGLKLRDLTILTALLINKTPHIRELFLPAGHIRMGCLDHLFNRNPSLLSELQSISFEGDDYFLCFDVAHYHRFLTLPNLQEANFEFAKLSDESFPTSWAPGTVNAEKISFRRCHMDVGGMERFMQACKRLKYFSYKNSHVDIIRERIPTPTPKREFNAPQFYQALLPHKDTLEHIGLTFADDPWDLENLEEHLSRRGTLGSFCDFDALESVYIAHAILPPRPDFPPSLKTLHIADCKSSIRDVVGHIAADCQKGLYPNLTEFKVFALDITQPVKLPGQIIPDGKTPEQCFHSLRDLFKDTKVDFQIMPFHMWDLRDLMDSDNYDDYDDYDDEYDGSDLDYHHHVMDLVDHDFPIGEGFGPGHHFGLGTPFGPMDGAIFDALARALGPPDNDASDNSWETDEDD
jgi:hypothetical protein